MECNFFEQFCEVAKKCDYISFDIFDTLIKRNVQKPIDIFKLVENEYNKKYKMNVSNFYLERINSEKNLRKKVKGEITLDQIYENLKGFSLREKKELETIEKKLEISLCQFNEDVRNIYEWALKNKKILIISDMYLDEKTIATILKKNNIMYYKLFVSSKYNKRKKDSELFKYVLNELNIDPEKILHFGDNELSDFLSPTKIGINSILYRQNKYNNYFNIKKITEDINYNIMCSFIENNIKRNNYFYNFGYECFGPILYGFNQWLINEIKKDKINRIFFLARDGKIMKKAFDIINNNSNIESYYFYASRRSIIVPSLWKYNNIDDILNSINIPQNISILDFQKRLGLDDVNISDLLTEYDLIYEKKYNLNDLKNNYHAFLDKLYVLITLNSREEYKNFINYKDNLNFNGKVAIVDIGWLGNMQLALNNICVKDTNISGYYLGLRHDKKRNIKSKGFMFDADKNFQYEKEQLYFNSIFEFIFSATHGSVKRFTSSQSKVEFYPNENIEKYENDALKSIQKGAIDFVNDLYQNEIHNILEFDEFNSLYNFFELLYRPSIEDADKFGQLKFLDGEIYYIAKKDKKFRFSSFQNSLWKIGYMRRNININLPFDKIYKIMKCIKK